ncbi:hypothetical protein MML48_4g00012703 [Holotrichia oblita]|uniref:Uncharacterized protein n=1 Tax=Holotrichia oblita TaxID=644536 RepID=A0ACB9T6E0_HOLOL|nr:hypothetical protein MML48_4g00012703 [Holotrichia oblita]
MSIFLVRFRLQKAEKKSLSSSGQYIPPIFIFKRNGMKEGLDRNDPVGAIYRCSKSGWIPEELFLEWLKHFKKNVNSSKDRPVLLVLDNHSTHSSLASYNSCRESGIHLVSFPPHTSHRFQPLDITFFGPVKSAYYQECNKYMRHKKYEKINTTDIAELVKNAFNRTAGIEKAVNGFQTTGIFPFNRDVFSEEGSICLLKVIDRRDETFDPSERHQTLPAIPAPPEEIGRPGPSGVGSKKRKILSLSTSESSSSVLTGVRL